MKRSWLGGQIDGSPTPRCESRSVLLQRPAAQLVLSSLKQVLALIEERIRGRGGLSHGLDMFRGWAVWNEVVDRASSLLKGARCLRASARWLPSSGFRLFGADCLRAREADWEAEHKGKSNQDPPSRPTHLRDPSRMTHPGDPKSRVGHCQECESSIIPRTRETSAQRTTYTE
jgi:hypothetical protein